MLLAVASNGPIFFKFLNRTNNEASVASFFIDLSQELDRKDSGWRSSHILLLDNCTSHKTKLVRDVLKKTGFPTLYTAPASYIACPVEELFSLVKKINIDKIATPTLQEVNRRNIT